MGARLGVQSAKSLAKRTVLSKLPLVLKCHLHTLCQEEIVGEEQFHTDVCVRVCVFITARGSENNLACAHPDVLLLSTCAS